MSYLELCSLKYPHTCSGYFHTAGELAAESQLSRMRNNAGLNRSLVMIVYVSEQFLVFKSFKMKINLYCGKSIRIQTLS